MCSVLVLLFFFFKQKTAYEMRISDWSSDVCSSDLDQKLGEVPFDAATEQAGFLVLEPDIQGVRARTIDLDFLEQREADIVAERAEVADFVGITRLQIGRASCRERVWQYG